MVTTLLVASLTLGQPPGYGTGAPLETGHSATLQLHLNDDIQLTFGNTSAAPDVWFDNNGTSMCFTSTSVDGGGTDGNIWCYTLGGNEILYTADLELDTYGAQILLDDGTAGNPGLAFGADGNTGLHRPSGDTLALVTGGLFYYFSNTSFTSYKSIDIYNGAELYNSAGLLPMRSVALNSRVVYELQTIAADDATPDVSDGTVFFTSDNTAPTAITDLDSPTVGQLVTICIGGTGTNASTITDGGNFNIAGNWTPGLDDCITLVVQADNDYIEIYSRVNN